MKTQIDAMNLLPFAVMTSARHVYLEQTIASLKVADEAAASASTTSTSTHMNGTSHKRTCIFIVDRTSFSGDSSEEDMKTDAAIRKASSFCNVITRIRTRAYMTTTNTNDNVNQHRSKHLKSHWLWSMSEIFEHSLTNYQGDVLILEDDVLVSPDIFLVVKYAAGTHCFLCCCCLLLFAVVTSSSTCIFTACFLIFAYIHYSVSAEWYRRSSTGDGIGRMGW